MNAFSVHIFTEVFCSLEVRCVRMRNGSVNSVLCLSIMFMKFIAIRSQGLFLRITLVTCPNSMQLRFKVVLVICYIQ